MIALLAAAPATGQSARELFREPGFALKLVSPGVASSDMPPGQGQLLLPLRGTIRVIETSGNGTKVTQTDRRDRASELGPGQLWRVANDAVWRIEASADAPVVLQISTSVPRHERRGDDLFALARRRGHVGPRRLFGNEALRVEMSVGRSPLPVLGWAPWSHTAVGTELAIVLAGGFFARLTHPSGATWSGRLAAGDLLRIPPHVAHHFAATTLVRPSIGLIVTSLRRDLGTEVSREAVRGFSPFIERG